MHVLLPLFAEESHLFAEKYINVNDVIGYCFVLVNEMRRNLIGMFCF